MSSFLLRDYTVSPSELVEGRTKEIMVEGASPDIPNQNLLLCMKSWLIHEVYTWMEPFMQDPHFVVSFQDWVVILDEKQERPVSTEWFTQQRAFRARLDEVLYKDPIEEPPPQDPQPQPEAQNTQPAQQDQPPDGPN